MYAPLSGAGAGEWFASVTARAEGAVVQPEGFSVENDLNQADPLTDGDYTYIVRSDDTAEIKSYTGSEKDIVIPDTLDGIAVTELGRSALGSDHENNTFKTVTIPASVTYISADNPFVFCTNLTEIKVAEGSADFCAEDGILYNKDKTEIICYPCCKKVDSFTIPDTVKKVGALRFTIPYLMI